MRMYLLDKKQRVRRWLKDNDFIEAEMTEEINAANQINFSMPLKDRIADNIYYVAIPAPRSKQKYLLFKLLSERVQNDRIEYQGIEEAYDELKQYGYIKDIRPNDRTAEEMLKMVLEPTRWTLGNVPETSHQSTNFYYITYLEALQKIVGLFNIELTFEVTIDPKSNKITRRQVNIYTEQGQRTGKRFEYGSNLLTVQQEQDSQELITALVGRGKGEQVSEGHDDTPDGYGRRITFADVVWTKKDGHPVDKPAGQEYLVDPEATALYGFSDGNPRIGLTVFEDIEDPVELINATWRALQSLKRPKVSFKADVTDVGQLGLGDTVAIIRHDLKIEYFTRVYKVKHNLLNENDNQIELGDDFSGHSITSSIIKVDEIANEARETAGHAAIAANGKNNNYYSSVQPLAPVEGDIWYKDLGNGETDMYQYHNGGWAFIQSTRDLHVVENQVKEAQDGLNQAKADIINNKQKADTDIENLNKSIEANKKAADQDIQSLNESIEANKKVADESLQKLNNSVTNLQGQYDNNVVPNLNKVIADASDALQKYISAQNSIADLTKQAQEQGKDIADVTNTVKGLNINYANLAGDVNSTKVDVKGLQTTLGTANGDIAQLKANAQNLQVMLAGKVDNSTYTNFVNLTNQALNARLTASDLNGYAKTVDVQATANGLKMNIDSVSGKLNNLRIGGKNLLYNSAGPFQPVFDGRIDNNQRYNNSTVNLVNGRQYTISGETNGVFSGDHQPEVESDKCILWLVNTSQNINRIVSDNNTANGTTFIWNRPTGTYILRVNTYHPASTNKIKAWNIKIESGNKKTDWSPAPEDVANDITQLSARITANSQQFSSYYTKMETDTKADTAKNDAVNAIKSDGNWQGLSNILTNSGFLQTADGFLQKVQQTTVPMFNGGGVNLVSGTTEDIIVDDTGNTGTQGWCFKTIPINADLEVGDKITVSVENVVLTGNGDLSKWGATLSSTDISEMRANNYEINVGKNAKVTITVTSMNDVNKQTALLIYSGRVSDTQGKKAIFHHLKVERGEIDTPYSPAPSDNVTQIAFSELSQSLDGLCSTVGSNYGDLQSQISQSSSAVRTDLTNKITGVQNQVTTTANGLTARIDSIRVGSTNLLINSAGPFQPVFDGRIDNNQRYNNSTVNLVNGRQYTISGETNGVFSGDHQPEVESDKCILWLVNTSQNINRIVSDNNTANGTTFIWNRPTGTYILRVNTYHPASTNKIKAWNIKIESGNKKTDWSPAPEDVEQAFAEVNATINGLKSTVSGNYGQLQNTISQTNQATRNELINKITGVENTTTSTANSLNSVIGRIGSLEHLTSVQVVNNAINANDYTTTGTYFVQSTSSSNVPATNWCYLEVKKVDNGRIVQTWQADSDPTLRYVRTKIGDSWTQWQRSASYSEYSELNRTVQGLQSTVSSNHNDLQSQISQTAKNIRQEVSDKTGGLQTQINQQGNNFNVSLNSLRKETAWQKVTSAIDANNYKTTGNYWIQAAPNSNTPDSSAWAYLQVVAYPDVKRIKQTWQRDNNENEIYTRLLIGDNWTGWQRTVTGGNIMAQINMSAGTTLIQNDKIYMDASSTIFSGNAFIPSAAITSLNADKITAGTLNAANVNIINLNANNITTGTINGQNLKIDLNTGNVEFQHGRIHNFSNTVDINLDQNYISTANYNTRALLKDGELQLTQPNLYDTNGNWYFRLYNGGGAGDAWAGASLIGRDSVIVANEANSQGATGFTSNPMGTATFSGLFTGKGTNSWMPTILGGAERGVFIKGGNQMSIKQNIMDPNDGGVFATGSPFISVGVDGPNNNWWGNRIVIDGEYLHVPTAWRHTTGGAPNLVVASDGALVRSTSASKYKTEIHRDYSTDYGDRLLELPTATWIDKGQKKRYQAGKRSIKPNKYFGMIAEDLADAGLDLFVSRNPQTHEIEGIQYERIAPALIPVIRKLKKKVQELEEKLNEQ